MTAVSHHRKDLMIEARFLPESLEQAKALRDRIRDAIASGEVDESVVGRRLAESTADSLTGWLIGKTDGVDGLTAPTRSRYRKILQVLEDQAPRGGRGIRGVLGLDVSAVIGAGSVAAGLAMATGGGVGAAVLALVAAPIIYAPGPDDPVGEELGELLEAA